MLITCSANDLIPIFQQGGIFSYPTESVYGLGCDPNNEEAVQRLLDIKNRHMRKGLILIATDFSQISQYLHNDILHPTNEANARSNKLAHQPSDTTFTHLVNEHTPKWLTGEFNSLAIRISKHPEVVQLCGAFGSAMVSTSANFSGQPPAKNFDEVVSIFSTNTKSSLIDAILEGTTGNLQQPSSIRDAATNEIIRP